VTPEEVFRTRLAAARKLCGLTQRTLGERLGMTGSSIGNLESGISRPSLDTLRRLGTVLDVSIDYLLGQPQKSVHLKGWPAFAEDCAQLSEADLAWIIGLTHSLLEEKHLMATRLHDRNVNIWRT
jgi:transcriptional regulator with XRE-family HTH domain